MILRKKNLCYCERIFCEFRCTYVSKSPIFFKSYKIKQKKKTIDKGTFLNKLAFPPHLEERIEKWQQLLECEIKFISNSHLKEKNIWDNFALK